MAASRKLYNELAKTIKMYKPDENDYQGADQYRFKSAFALWQSMAFAIMRDLSDDNSAFVSSKFRSACGLD